MGNTEPAPSCEGDGGLVLGQEQEEQQHQEQQQQQDGVHALHVVVVAVSGLRVSLPQREQPRGFPPSRHLCQD